MPEEIEHKKKKRRFKKRYGILLFISILLLTLFISFRSPLFWKFALPTISGLIPGEIDAELVDVNLGQGKITVKNLKYKRNNNIIVSLDQAIIHLSYGYSFRLLWGIEKLEAVGLKIDQRYLPKRKNSVSWRNAVKFILNHIVVEEGHLKHFELTTRQNVKIKIQQIKLKYLKEIFSQHDATLWVSNTHIEKEDKNYWTDKIKYSGKIKLNTWGSYPFIVRSAGGQLSIKNLGYNNRKIADLHTHLNIDESAISFQKSEAHSLLGGIYFDLAADLENKTLTLDSQSLEPIRFDRFPKMSKHVQRNTEAFDYNLKLDLKTNEVKELRELKGLSGRIDLEAKTYGNQASPKDDGQELKIKTNIKKGILKFENFSIQSPQTDLKVSGQINLEKKTLDTQVSAKKIDVGTLFGFISDLEITGQSQAKGFIKGSFKNPHFEITNQANLANYAILYFKDSQGKLSIKNKKLSYEASFNNNFGKVDFKVSVNHLFDKKKRRSEINTQFDQMDLATLLDNPFFKGKLSGTYQMQSSNNGSKSGTLKASVQNMLAYYYNLGNVKSDGQLKNQTFTLSNLEFTPPKYATQKTVSDIVFKFNPEQGFSVAGEAFTGARFEGNYSYKNRTHFNLKAKFKNIDLRLLEAIYEYPQIEAYADGNLEAKIGLGLNTLSQADIKISQFRMPLEDSEIKNSGPIHFRFQNNQFQFINTAFKSANNIFKISGYFIPTKSWALKIQGKVNLAVIKVMSSFFREISGYASTNLKLGGAWLNPDIDGSIEFHNSNLRLRSYQPNLEELRGKLIFKNNNLSFNQFKAEVEDGDIEISGSIKLENLSAKHYQLKLKANEMTYFEPGYYKLIFNGQFELKGPAESPQLKGKAEITEGRFSQNFNVADSIIKAEAIPNYLGDEVGLFDNMQMDIKVTSPGELLVKNDIAEIYLSAALQFGGSFKEPKYHGKLQIIDGKFTYFNVEFDDAQGFVEFKKNNPQPYLEMKGIESFESFSNLTTLEAKVKGFINNLKIRFRSSPPLSKRDINNLLITGVLPGDVRFLGRGTNFTSTLLSSQLTGFIGKPIKKFTKLDIFRMEAADLEEEEGSALVIGKRITDQFSLEFKTDLFGDSQLRSIQSEYLILDNVLLKSSYNSQGRFRLNLNFRWELY